MFFKSIISPIKRLLQPKFIPHIRFIAYVTPLYFSRPHSDTKQSNVNIMQRAFSTFRGVLSVVLLFLLASATVAHAQKFGYPQVNERQVIGTKWRYSYTLHFESNTVVHQSEKEYQYYLYFKYDFTFEQYLNQKNSKGTWSLNGSTLYYPFRNIKKFEIAQINANTLVLEFQQPNSQGTYQYHFVAVESKDAPFARPANELEEVTVYAQTKNKRRWWQAFRKGGDPLNPSVGVRKDPVPIQIELTGGGFYGGIDPVVKDYIQIKSDGRLIREYQSINQPLMVTKKNISRQELEEFAEYITQNKFFEMQRIYDCNSAQCEKRKMNKPTPIPLRLMITYGDKKKVVTIGIWGQDQNRVRYVDYPQSLDYIIDAIQRFANRIEDRRVGNSN